jgi:probable HAF family extracellular repeat protein
MTGKSNSFIPAGGVSSMIANLRSRALVVFLLSPLAFTQDYVITKLPTLGGQRTFAPGINDQGQVVGGAATTNGNDHAFVWTRLGGIQDLGTLGGGSSQASGINASGQVAGTADTAFAGDAFLWSPSAGMQNLGALGAYSSASGVNNSAEVAGDSQVGYTDIVHAILWTQSGGMQDLGTLPGGTLGSFATGINNPGQVVGGSYVANSYEHAFLWTPTGGMQDLGTLGGLNSVASAINDSGEVVGYSDIPGGFQHAFWWTEGSGMKDIGTLPGFTFSSASGITAAGEVVGSSWTQTGGSPFLWTLNGGMNALGPFGKISLSNGNAISDAGLILASWYTRNAGYSSYLLTPAMNTTLTSSPNPSVVGQQITLVAAVNSSVVGAPPNGENVTFTDGKSVLSVLPLENGSATFRTSSLAKGTKALYATYAGDANYASSKSIVVEQAVNAYATSTALASSLNPSIYGQSVTMIATVTTSGPTIPTGTVSFKWDSSGWGPVTLNANGVATLTKPILNADTYPLTAVYTGDANNAGSTSVAVNQVVTKATSSATLTSSPNPSTQAQAVTFTATISSPTVAAKGPVTFTAGKTVLGTAQLSGGKAKFTTSTLTVGSTTVTAAYLGDSNIAGSSASVTQTVQP